MSQLKIYIYINGKYFFIVIANDKPSKRLNNILRLRYKTKLRKLIFIFVIILYDNLLSITGFSLLPICLD